MLSLKRRILKLFGLWNTYIYDCEFEGHPNQLMKYKKSELIDIMLNYIGFISTRDQKDKGPEFMFFVETYGEKLKKERKYEKIVGEKDV